MGDDTSSTVGGLGSAPGGSPCPACLGEGQIELPSNDGAEPYLCPVCRPWWTQNGWPGLQIAGRWVIGPAAPGERAPWHGTSGPVHLTNHRPESRDLGAAERAAESARNEGT